MTTYSAKDLDREARAAAASHSKANGGGRPLGVTWNLVLTAALLPPTLHVGYHCNCPHGNRVHYATSVAI